MPQNQSKRISNKTQNISPEEHLRLQDLLVYEQAAYLQGYQSIAGIDEAGRGPLAGPVVAAACILPHGFLMAGVDDSKKLTPSRRYVLFEQLISIPQIHYGIGVISHQEIDQINIYQATIRAMLNAVASLPSVPDLLFVDGMTLPLEQIPCQKIIGGDGKSLSIAAASIIAKETRDRLMCEYHEQWPHYGFDKHKGYATALHTAAIEKYGPCPIHRLSFKPVSERNRLV